MEDQRFGRRVFLARTLVLPPSLAALATLLAEACVSDNSPYPMYSSSGSSTASGVSGDISSNHGHTVTITDVQLSAAGDVTLTLLDGGSGHTHTLSLTASRVAEIALNYLVGPLASTATVTTLYGTHAHNVTFNTTSSPHTFSDITTVNMTLQHGHAVTITASELDIGGPATLLLTDAGAGHTHSLSLASAQVAQLVLGHVLGPITSTITLSHSHDVSFP